MYMNKPIDYEWTENDIMNEYNWCKDKKKVAKIFCIPTSEVTKILKRMGVIF